MALPALLALSHKMLSFGLTPVGLSLAGGLSATAALADALRAKTRRAGDKPEEAKENPDPKRIASRLDQLHRMIQQGRLSKLKDMSSGSNRATFQDAGYEY